MLLYLVVGISLCLAPALANEECADGFGASYRGTVSTTAGGLQCQRWDQQSPHPHTRTPDNYASSGLESNYCRNPDGGSYPWCYTTSSTRWDYCAVPSCLDYLANCYYSHGAAYRGIVSQTKTGKTCQRWDSQTPHEHTRTRENYPTYGLDGNYCRNPDDGAGPWCFTTDPGSRWEYCDIPPCPDQPNGYRPF